MATHMLEDEAQDASFEMVETVPTMPQAKAKEIKVTINTSAGNTLALEYEKLRRIQDTIKRKQGELAIQKKIIKLLEQARDLRK